MSFTYMQDLPHNATIHETHIENIMPGMTVMHYGEIKTVTRQNIGYSSFMGRSIFGDCYKNGHELVKRIIFKVPIHIPPFYRYE